MTDHIRFVLGAEVIELRDVDPTLTVLQYLRTVVRRTGTKEGCAEGDCGACTVVLGELNGDGIRYRAVNSCLLFVPALDGKQLITIEDVGGSSDVLHPVQGAMVTHHGSQCGFCTPGFVMSLFALHQGDPNPTREQIELAIAGNLCRCTGYVPIVEAGRDMAALPVGCTALETDRMEPMLESIRREDALSLTYEGRRFLAPRRMEELAQLMARYPTAIVLAGGTDVGLWVTKQLRALNTVIYIGEIAELRVIRQTKSSLEIGAAVSLEDARTVLCSSYPQFNELMDRFGSLQIRHSGTLVGNVANASPIGDLNPVLLALDATVQVGGAERRQIPIDEFFTGYRRTALADGEFIERISIPTPPDALVAAYKVSKRFDQDISAVCGVFNVSVKGGVVEGARIAFGGMAEVPKRAQRSEAALIGHRWNLDGAVTAARALEQDFTPISDMRASATYRMNVARNLFERFYRESVDEKCRVTEDTGV